MCPLLKPTLRPFLSNKALSRFRSLLLRHTLGDPEQDLDPPEEEPSDPAEVEAADPAEAEVDPLDQGLPDHQAHQDRQDQETPDLPDCRDQLHSSPPVST
jgi:hypothetical protein